MNVRPVVARRAAGEALAARCLCRLSSPRTPLGLARVASGRCPLVGRPTVADLPMVVWSGSSAAGKLRRCRWLGQGPEVRLMSAFCGEHHACCGSGVW
ncbi:hypothetical protein [Fodinicola feengrottensis]|uniref:hypothetical protein n=1 Tax=Fodinicola feengrottensis TaxID=435914 RepID=UPI0013D11DFF|nr:hypothetical protein [Fodinicola feengrottensis]